MSSGTTVADRLVAVARVCGGVLDLDLELDDTRWTPDDDATALLVRVCIGDGVREASEAGVGGATEAFAFALTALRFGPARCARGVGDLESDLAWRGCTLTCGSSSLLSSFRFE